MIVDQQKTDALIAEVFEKTRSSVRQSRDSIVQQSYRRLANNLGDVEALNLLAAFNLHNHNPQKSLQLLAADPAILRDNPLGHRVAGYACLVQQQTDAARTHFDQSVRLDPRQPDCWTMLGRISEDAGNEESAFECYRRALVFDDTQHESALSLAKLHVGNGNLKEAIHILRVALLRDKRSVKLNLRLPDCFAVGPHDLDAVENTAPNVGSWRKHAVAIALSTIRLPPR